MVTAGAMSGTAIISARNEGVLAFQHQQRFFVGTTPRSVAVGDLNADGAPDLVTVNEFFNDVAVLLGNGDGTFQIASHPYRRAAGAVVGESVRPLDGDNVIKPWRDVVRKIRLLHGKAIRPGNLVGLVWIGSVLFPR